MQLIFSGDDNSTAADELIAAATVLGFTLVPPSDVVDVLSLEIGTCITLDARVEEALGERGLRTLGDLTRRSAYDVWLIIRHLNVFSVDSNFTRTVIETMESRKLSFADVAPSELKLFDASRWQEQFELSARAARRLTHFGVFGVAILRAMSIQDINDFPHCAQALRNEIVAVRNMLRQQ